MTGPLETGLGLTLAELQKVVDSMARYCENDNPNSNYSVEALRIDSKFHSAASAKPQQDYNDGYRRYRSGTGTHQFDRMIDWFNAIDHNYGIEVTSLDTRYSQRRLQRYFCYVGLSNKVLGRATEHATQADVESPVWGLFTATCQHLYPEKFAIQPFTYQVIRTVRTEDIGIDEILISILASAYCWDGGLSALHAGKQQGRKATKDERYYKMLKENASVHKTTGHQTKNMDHSVEKYQEGLGIIKFKQDDGTELKELVARLDELKSKVEEAVTYYRNLVAHLKLQMVRYSMVELKI